MSYADDAGAAAKAVPNRPIGPMSLLHKLRAMPGGNILIAFLAIEFFCVLGALLFPNQFRYLSSANIAVTLEAIPTVGFISLGVGLLMIAGEFDLSVGSVYTFSSIIGATLLDNFGIPAWIGLVVAVALGAAIGLVNGLITIRFAMPSFIVTLGGLLFWHGMTFLVHGAQSIGFRPDPVFQFVFGGSLGLVGTSFLWLILCCVGFHMILQHHRLGNQIFAVGGNRDAATAIGISPRKIKLIAFSIAGAMAAFSGIISATRVNSINPAQGQGVELQAIAACVIGGLALTGGRGGILGIFLGAALIYTIQDVLLLMRAPGFYLDIFVGALIVIAVIFNQVAGNRFRR
jgi:ribose/xylose/arabinose/galactoside ABC-type transport system permease subunit